MSPIANASDELTPIALPISTAASSNVPRLAGPAGIADASATPDASSAAWPIVSCTSTDWPAAANARIVAPQAIALSRQRLDERPRPARDAQPVAQPGDRLADPRVALGPGRDPLGARQAVRGDPDRESDRQQPGHRDARQHGARDDAPDGQHEDRDRRDRDDRDEVDDALDDDRAEGRRPGDALAVAGVVAPDQLADPGRQDVVREVAASR